MLDYRHEHHPALSEVLGNVGDALALIEADNRNSSAPSWDVPGGEWRRDNLPEMAVCVVTYQFMAGTSGLGLESQGLRRKEEVLDISL